VAACVEQIRDRGRVGSFICESLLGCGGQIVLPPGYLKEAYRQVRNAGGVCIADEVQVGFGRVGTHFWAFESQGVVPDIVTLGKPIGNGHPIGAVVTTPEIAASFDNGMEYFNTFGGNPVSCAIGLAVLDVIDEEGLQENALRVGARLMEGLRGLMERHPLIGDVRGLGMFIGIELVLDRETQEPAPLQADYLVNRMRERGILLSTDGPFHNVIKIKPPLVFTEANADFLVMTMGNLLKEDFFDR
jgi:4-aminobutyrate aminotransferase-like enzyme